MSTKEVFQAWLDLPGRFEILAFSNLQQGFDFTVEHFNVLQELLDREDVGPVVQKCYVDMEVNNLHQKNSDREKGKFITDFGSIELLLSQPKVLNSLSVNDKIKLLKQTFEYLNIKQNLENKNKDSFWEGTSLVLAGRILRNLGDRKLLETEKRNENIKTALDCGEINLKNEYDEIYKCIMNFVEKN